MTTHSLAGAETAPHHPGYLRIALILASAAFVVGTSAYFVSGVVAQIALDFGVPLGVAGQVTSAFAVAYALTAPALVSLTAGIERRRLMTLALCAFSGACVLSALTQDFSLLLAARVLSALAATMITPVAVAVAAQLAPMQRRGAIMAVVTGGITMAFALGVPLGTYAGAVADWRSVFLMLAALAVAVALIIRASVPAVPGTPRPRGPTGPGLLSDPAIRRVLMMTSLMFACAFTVFAYIGPVLSEVVGAGPAGKSVLLLIFGLSALLGTFSGGWISDRMGSGRIMTFTLCLFALAHLGFTLLALVPAGMPRIAAAGLLMVMASIPGFALMPMQQARLAVRARERTPIAIAWHASSLFVGQGLGAVIGGFVVGTGAVLWLGAVAGAIGVVIVLLSMDTNRRWFAPSRPGP